MKLFIATDLHGETADCPKETDLVLIAGDFSKGDKLREVVFGRGKIEDAKVEILESSKKLLDALPKRSILSSGNVEKLCLEEVSKQVRSKGHIFLTNAAIEIKGIKILGLEFFMEEWWARGAYPNNEDKIQRAISEEKEMKKLLEDNPDADIILSHLPPYNVLDIGTRPEFMPKSHPEHCGSKLLLEYIKKNKPKLVVTGHIHKPDEAMIGKTKVINPGKGKLIDFS